MTTCKNCDTTFEGKHCPECGQKADTHRLTLPHLAHEIFHALTHTDKGILFLIKELMYRPGYVAREYNAGKRKKYFNPFTFLLIVVALQIFILKKAHFYENFTSEMKKFETELRIKSGAPVPDVSQQSAPTLNAEESMALMEENSKMITFIFIPFMALMTWLFFGRSSANYAENLVMQTLAFGQNTVFFLIITIPFLFSHSLYLWVLSASFVLQMVYNTIVYKQFFQQSWGKTIWKTVIVLVLYMIFTNAVFEIAKLIL